MEIISKVSSWIRGVTEIALSILMLGIVVQIIFGASTVFLPFNILANVIAVSYTHLTLPTKRIV